MLSRLFYHQSKAEIEPVTDLDDLLGSQTDSLALDFESFDDGNIIAIQADKPMDLSTFNAVLDDYQDSWLEDLVYSSELG